MSESEKDSELEFESDKKIKNKKNKKHLSKN